MLLSSYKNCPKPYPEILLSTIEPLRKILLSCNESTIVQVGINCILSLIQNIQLNEGKITDDILQSFLIILSRELDGERDEDSCLYIGECLYTIQIHYNLPQQMKNDIFIKVINKLLLSKLCGIKQSLLYYILRNLYDNNTEEYLKLLNESQLISLLNIWNEIHETFSTEYKIKVSCLSIMKLLLLNLPFIMNAKIDGNPIIDINQGIITRSHKNLVYIYNI